LLLRYKQHQSGERGSLNTSPYRSNAYTDPNEAKVYQKLNEINTAMNASNAKVNQRTTYPEAYPSKRTVISSADIDRLEQLMDQTKSGVREEDPEIKQLNEIMEKIMDIQHPERVKQQMSQASQAAKGHFFAVTINSGNVHPSLLENDEEDTPIDSMQLNQLQGFFSLENEPAGIREQQNTIQAAIHKTQTLVDGSIVKLRLLEDVSVNDLLIPKGSFIFGKASLQGERLHIKISAILFKNSFFPVQLSVVDMDGIEGIHVPGSITREVSGNSADRALQGIGATLPDPSLGAQAANAGIEAAKTLLRKKTKLVKVTLKGGYQVLLIDEKQKTSF
jgi:conjugative transposon TraM protein